MANSFVLKIFVLFVVTITITTNKKLKVAANDLISEICPKTKNPATCNRILRSKPEAEEATTLHQLGKICMFLGTLHAAEVVTEFNGLLKTRGLREKSKYKLCRSEYVTAYQKIHEAKNKFAKNELESALQHAAVAARAPLECRTQFAQDHEPEVIKRINDEADAIFSIPLTVVQEVHRSGGN